MTLKDEVATLLAANEYPLLGVERDVALASGVADFALWDDSRQMEVIAMVSEEFSAEAWEWVEKLAAEYENDGDEHPMGVMGVLIVSMKASGWPGDAEVWVYRDGDLFRRRPN